MNKEVVKKNFSKYARYYDKYATIQDLCALRLISKVKSNGFCNILDVGCGTGNYTRLLKRSFPLAHIKAVDISKEMIKIAEEKLKGEGIEFIIADGEMINFHERFDLISSNAVFQWFEDLEGSLSRYKGLLKKESIISFSTFGPQTFCELDTSLKELFDRDVSISSGNFVGLGSIEKILKALFREFEIEEEIYKERYHSLSELLKKIRYTGTRGNGINGNGFWTPKIMDDLEKIYRKRFKDITATYQVFFCKGVR